MIFLGTILLIALGMLYAGLAIKFSMWLADQFGGVLTYMVVAITLVIGVPAGLIGQFSGG